MKLDRREDIIPAWFWKIAALCTIGGTITLVTVGWSLGSFMSETQTWQKAQDDRFFTHLEESRELHTQMIDSVSSIRETVTVNNQYGTQFKERMDAIHHRLNLLETKD